MSINEQKMLEGIAAFKSANAYGRIIFIITMMVGMALSGFFFGCFFYGVFNKILHMEYITFFRAFIMGFIINLMVCIKNMYLTNQKFSKEK